MLRVLGLCVAVLTSLSAFADSRCDCDEIVRSCTARVTEIPTQSPGTKFRLKANTEQCAIVEWAVDGDRGQTTIWDDGEDVSRVSPRKPGGTIEVLSCRVCKDKRYPTKSSETDAGHGNFCAALEEVNNKCGLPSMGGACNSNIKSEMKVQWAGLEGECQEQLKLATAAEQVAADYERIGMEKGAKEARASAARSRQVAASLQCLASQRAKLFPD